MASELFVHVPHPRVARRDRPVAIADMHPRAGAIQRFNSFVAVRITGAVGTMWAAYAFAGLALISVTDAVRGGRAAFISWLAQDFLQLVLLSIIIVGQRVAGAASDQRAANTYADTEALLHEVAQLQAHLAAQDRVLSELRVGAADPPTRT